ncbi:MAG: BamA/TamA family outer membrane protein [Ignavibacteriales bacterium]|nr:BamA/TamA family outer membrane protein [Ignavibacteriales bacterium]
MAEPFTRSPEPIRRAFFIMGGTIQTLSSRGVLAALVVLLVGYSARAQESPTERSRPKIGLALSGGSALGFAHIGALEVIDSLGVPIDYVAGTSMGGLVGGLYAIGYAPSEIREIVMSQNWDRVLSDRVPRAKTSHVEKSFNRRYQVDLPFSGWRPRAPSGLIAGQNVSTLLSSLAVAHHGVRDFDSLPLPFRCVAADLVSGEAMALGEGSLPEALRATMSIPTVFAPVPYADTLLFVDGGVINNFPTDVAQRMGADVTIGLKLDFPAPKLDELDDVMSVLDRTIDLPRRRVLTENVERTDILINENVAGLSLAAYDPDVIPEIIARGKRAAYAQIHELLKLRRRLDPYLDLDALDGKATIGSVRAFADAPVRLDSAIARSGLRVGDVYRASSVSEAKSRLAASGAFRSGEIRVRPRSLDSVDVVIRLRLAKPPQIHNVLVEGNRDLDFGFLYNNLGLAPGDEFSTASVEAALDRLYGMGLFKKLDYRALPRTDSSVTLKLLVEERDAQHFYFGVRYDDYRNLVAGVGAYSNSFLVSGARAEAEWRFGGLTKARARVAYPVRSFDVSAYPYLAARYRDLPTDMYDVHGDKVSQYDDEAIEIAGGLGFVVGEAAALEAEYQEEYAEIAGLFVSGEDTTATVRKWSDRLRMLAAALTLDALDDAHMPRRGVYLRADAELSLDALGSPYDFFRLDGAFDVYHPLYGAHSIRLGGSFRRVWGDAPLYKQYAFGGLDSFVGLQYDQRRGDKFVVASGAYRFEIFEGAFLEAIVNVAFENDLWTIYEIEEDRTMLGYGLAFEIGTLVGPARLLAAAGDKSPKNPDETQLLLQFSFGYPL